MCRVGRTLLSAGFDFGFDLELKIYVKGGGQECPPYTFLYNLGRQKNYGVPRRIVPVRPQVDCPDHHRCNPG